MLTIDKNIRKLCLLSLLASCGSSSFSSNDQIVEPENGLEARGNTGLQTASEEPAESGSLEEGVYGGHFDVDTFDGNNKKLEHVHEFDDSYQTNGIVFVGEENFSKKHSGLSLSNYFEEEKLLDTVFRLRLVNSEYNQGAALNINGKRYTHDSLPDSQKLYKLGSSSSSNAEYTALTELSLTVDENAFLENLFSVSTPGCVQKNQLGPDNQKRNGALTLEVLDQNENVIWEISVYQHGASCI